MAWIPHAFVLPWDVVWYWGCVAPVEKRASSAVADAQGILLPGASADAVDLFFQIDSPLWWEKRLAAWRGNWQIVEREDGEGEDAVRIYATDAAWAVDLFNCQLAFGCTYSDSDCPSRPSWSSPSA